MKIYKSVFYYWAEYKHYYAFGITHAEAIKNFFAIWPECFEG